MTGASLPAMRFAIDRSSLLVSFLSVYVVAEYSRQQLWPRLARSNHKD